MQAGREWQRSLGGPALVALVLGAVLSGCAESRIPGATRYAIHYADTNRRWSTEGWWTVAANSRTGYLATKDGVLRSNTAQLYFFAESVDQSAWTWAGDHPTTVGDRTVAMRKLVDKEGDTEIVLVCEPSPSI